MGFLDGIFGRKTDCYQCEKIVKERNTLFRRGLRFCSSECVGLFLHENPPKTAVGGTPAHYTQQVIVEINSALGELAQLVRATGGSFSAANHHGAVGNIVGGAAALTDFNQAMSCVGQFNDYVRTALPYVHALGRVNDAETLETIDLDPILMMSRSVASHGGLQQGNIRRLTEETYQKVSAIVHAVATGS